LDSFIDFEVNEQVTKQEGNLYRIDSASKLKLYYFTLIGNQFYWFKKKGDIQHKRMHNLVGVYVEMEPKVIQQGKTLYPFNLMFPPNKTRRYYALTETECTQWVNLIKTTIGYTSVTDFYEIKNLLGKGKFGEVKLAIHIKTNKKVAIKIIKKSALNALEMEL